MWKEFDIIILLLFHIYKHINLWPRIQHPQKISKIPFIEVRWTVGFFVKILLFMLIEIMIFCPNPLNFNRLLNSYSSNCRLHWFIVIELMVFSYSSSQHSWFIEIHNHGLKKNSWAGWTVWTHEFLWINEFLATIEF